MLLLQGFKSRDCMGKGSNMYLMSLCDNFDQLFVHSSRPTKGHPIMYRPIYKKKKC